MKFSEFITEAKSVWEEQNDKQIAKKYKGGWLILMYSEEFRADEEDKQGNIKKMGDEYKTLDDFLDFLVDEYGLDWRTKDSKALEFLESFKR